ncbi:MAG TPA: carbonic anhydrase [Thermodesulfobacteriota bacterium]|nr:carbonic anhydrase [Thermodesulfobacteriota bacterium]
MSENLSSILDANSEYADSFGEKANLAMPPARKFAILTCMDARLDPAKFAGLSEGDAHVVRNAGGRASDDAIRSLVISSEVLGTREWFVIHHSDCGMETFTNEKISGDLKNTFDTNEGYFINWLTIPDREESVKEDVSRLRSHPLVSGDIRISGYIFDVKNGKLTEVVKG